MHCVNSGDGSGDSNIFLNLLEISKNIHTKSQVKGQNVRTLS